MKRTSAEFITINVIINMVKWHVAHTEDTEMKIFITATATEMRSSFSFNIKI